MKKTTTKIRLNDQNEVDQIIGNPPGWLLRWGLTVLLIAVLLFSALAWMIKYPDVMPAKVIFVTEQPAVRVVAPSSGKIEQLLTKNNQPIEEGQRIAVLENSANTEDVIELKNKLSELEINPTLSNKNLRESFSLGSMQNSYSRLILKIKNYTQFSGQTANAQRVISIQNRIESIKKLNSNISKQKATLDEEIALVKADYERNLKLKEIGEASNLEIEKSKSLYLQSQRQVENFDNQILNNKVIISELESQILDLKELRSTDDSDKKLAIDEEIQRLKSEIADWELTYLIKAPVTGIISFSKNWTTQQFININEELLTIVPSGDSQKIVGRAFLPVAGSGKVEVGQIANIQLDGFPFREFGILKSKIIDISLVPINDNYLVELELTNGLKTTYDKSIPFRQEMQGTAKIVTENRRVMDRIFDKLLNILRNT